MEFDIEKSFARELSFNFKHAIIAMVQIIRTPHTYFAGRLRDATKGFGTKDVNLQRVMVSRSEVWQQNAMHLCHWCTSG